VRSRRQTLSQGPVPRKPRSYLSRRKHSVAPHRRGSRRPSLVSEDGRSLCLLRPAIWSRPISPLAYLQQCAARNPSSEDARRQKLALLRFTSLLGRPSLEQISADDVTSHPLLPT
jgi:hypothetical protein